MLYRPKSLGTTMVDLYTDADARAGMRTEWLEDKGGRTYTTFLADGPAPIPVQ